MRATSLVFAALALSACSAMDQLQQKRDDQRRDGKGNELDENGDQQNGTGTADAPAFGLGDGCKFENNCFVCEPRELPIEACVPGDLPAGFDPAAVCQRDDNKLTCDIGGEEPFVFDFTNKNKDEQLYERLPGLLAGLKLYLDVELKDKPEQLATLTSALAILAKHKKALFMANDVLPAFDEAIALAKEKKANLKDADVEAMKANLHAAIAAWKEKKRAGDVKDGDILALAQSLIGSLPDGVAAKLPALDPAGILDKLQGAQNVDLSSVLTMLPGGDLTAILAILRGPGGAAADEGDDAADEEDE